jgi:hypothetical protein
MKYIISIGALLVAAVTVSAPLFGLLMLAAL